MQAARAERPNNWHSDGGTYLYWYENPRCNWLNERCFAQNPVPSTQRFDSQASAFVLLCALLKTSKYFEAALSGSQAHTQSAYRSEGGAADTAAVLRTDATVAAKLIRTCVTRKA